MARPSLLAPSALADWLNAHPAWTREDDALVRRLPFPDFSAALACAVRVGMLAEKRDHHPDLHVAWGRLVVRWTTHDAGGLTSLDLALAEATDTLVASS